MITLYDIWASSTGLLKRFDLMPSPKKSWGKMNEELWELQEALFKLSGNRKNIPYKDDTAEELADVIVTVLNVAYSAGLDIADIEKALQRVIDKNGSKNHETHISDGGWIKRREPVAYIEEGQS